MRFIRTQAAVINESVSAGSELREGLRPIFELLAKVVRCSPLQARLAGRLRTQPRFHFLPSANLAKL